MVMHTTECKHTYSLSFMPYQKDSFCYDVNHCGRSITVTHTKAKTKALWLYLFCKITLTLFEMSDS